MQVHSGDGDADTTEPAGDEQSLAHKRGLRRADEIVQQLAVAKYALTIGDIPRAMAAIDAALTTARRSLSDLLDLLSPPQPQEAATRYAGMMVREDAAGTERPRMQAASHIPPTYARTRAPQP